MEDFCRSSAQAISAFDLGQIDASQVVNIVRMATLDIGVDDGLMQVRGQVALLYISRPIEVVLDIWRKANIHHVDTISDVLRDGWAS